MIKLHPVKRATKASNRYCGPAVLSILTGLDTKDCATLLRSIHGKRRIIGTNLAEVGGALRKLGFEVADITHSYTDRPKRQRPTFARWQRETKPRADQTLLLSFGGHWGIVQGRRYACGITGKPVPLSQVPHRRARVKEVSLIRRVARVDGLSVIAALPAVAAKATFLSQSSDRMAVKRLAEPYSIDVDDSNRDKDDPDGTIWVYPGSQWPEGLVDPFDDEHYHDDWASARKAVETYIAALVAHRASSGLTPTPTSATVTTTP